MGIFTLITGVLVVCIWIAGWEKKKGKQQNIERLLSEGRHREIADWCVRNKNGLPLCQHSGTGRIAFSIPAIHNRERGGMQVLIFPTKEAAEEFVKFRSSKGGHFIQPYV